MSKIYIGSARHDEHGACYTGGAAGDQLQTSVPDYSGEVSMQEMYTHTSGWYIMRPIDPKIAAKIAERMIAACNNPHIGYDQYDRNQIITNGIDTEKDTDSDCSSLMREVVKEASGKDPGDFTTAGEVDALYATGLFHSKVAYVNQSTTPVYEGDALITKVKGHTAAVVSGSPRPDAVVTYDEGWIKDSVGWWYQYSDGTYPTSCWKLINAHWYYFGSSGYMKTGWQLIGGEWYYLEGNNDEGYEGACWHECSKQNGALERWDVEEDSAESSASSSAEGVGPGY